jgi:hypothetical protein
MAAKLGSPQMRLGRAILLLAMGNQDDARDLGDALFVIDGDRWVPSDLVVKIADERPPGPAQLAGNRLGMSHSGDRDHHLSQWSDQVKSVQNRGPDG